MPFYTHPWEYLVLDDFYDAGLFAKMTEELTAYIGDREHGVSSRHQIKRVHTQQAEAFPHTAACIASRLIDESYLAHFSQVRPYTELSLFTDVNVCMDDLSFPIHDEIETKVLSSVTYLLPETSKGTTLYDRDKQFVTTIEWKPNRTLIFAAQSGVTWHSYESAAGSYRMTVNQFLMRPV